MIDNINKEINKLCSEGKYEEAVGGLGILSDYFEEIGDEEKSRFYRYFYQKELIPKKFVHNDLDFWSFLKEDFYKSPKLLFRYGYISCISPSEVFKTFISLRLIKDWKQYEE